MITYEKGSLLNSNTEMIAHQVSCKGDMGSGVSKLISENFPGNYEKYKSVCKKKKSEKLLGTNLIVYESDFYICNMFSLDDEQFTDHEYFEKCICNIYEECLSTGHSVAFPAWDDAIAEKIIKDYFKKSDIICKIREL